MKPHRLFIAALFSSDFLNLIEQWKQSHESLPVRWVKRENLHMTLVPPWHTDDIGKCITDLKRTDSTLQPLTITFTSVSFGPSVAQPTTLWALGTDNAELSRLVGLLGDAVSSPNRERDFKPHVTLGRVKKADLYSVPDSFGEQIDWQSTITSVSLMESHLQPEGSDYEVIATFPYQTR